MLTLKQCQAEDGTGHIIATYALTQAGAKGAEPLQAQLQLKIHNDGAEASIDLGAAGAASEEEAFEKLAVTLELAAKGLRARGEPKLGVPVY